MATSQLLEILFTRPHFNFCSIIIRQKKMAQDEHGNRETKKKSNVKEKDKIKTKEKPPSKV